MFIYSYIVLWIVLIALTLSMIVIMRRITPAKPRLDMDDVGLEKGSKSPILKFETFSKENIDLDVSDNLGTVALYLSVNCGACANVLADLPTYIKAHKDLSVVVFMQGEDEKEILQKAGNLPELVPFIPLKDEYINSFRISLFPFAYFLSSKGIVLAKGGVPAGMPHLKLLTHLALSEKQRKMAS
ncbi:hypothetical protein [Lysinibacillus boronitolerans]|uniref:hypothetical protein n=1 Tax=Lysinibacillus boronitolerans TaxID=309788 RepID=UPI003851835D